MTRTHNTAAKGRASVCTLATTMMEEVAKEAAKAFR